jgi:hypothetical protein
MFEFTQLYPYEGEGYYWLMLGFMCDFNKAVTSYGRSVYVYPTNVGENTVDLTRLNIYPNPAKDYTTISFVSHNNTPATLKIFNSSGQVVKERFLSIATGKNIIRIDAKKLPSGIYFININSPGKLNKTIKFVK